MTWSNWTRRWRSSMRSTVGRGTPPTSATVDDSPFYPFTAQIGLPNMTQGAVLDLALFFFATFLGALVAGLAGFAFGLIASAMWLHIISPAQSAPLIAAFAIVIQGATLWKFRHAMQVSRLFPFLAGGAVGIPIGTAVLHWASAAHMRATIGAALVLFSVYSLARPALPPVKGGTFADGLVGFASGVIGGGTGLAGIPVIVWASLRRWSKDEQRAIFQPVVVAIFLMMLLWFGGAGIITTATLQLFAIGLPAVLIGTWFGFKLYGKLNEATFRVVVLVLLLLSGLTLLPWTWIRGA
jgi:uncharacterized protein